MLPIWITTGLVVVLGIPFLLWWWRDADRWLKAEHRRFTPKFDPREKIVVKNFTPTETGTQPPSDSSKSPEGPRSA